MSRARAAVRAAASAAARETLRAAGAPVLFDATGQRVATGAYPGGGAAGRLSGGYIGARTDRNATKEWRPAAGSPDGDTLPDVPAIRARAADLARNAPIAVGAINNVTTAVVGPGLTAYARIDREYLAIPEDAADTWERQADRIWRLHAESAAIDLHRTHTFADLTELALRSALVRGDVFAVRHYVERPGDLLATRVQLIEADRVCNPYFGHDTDTLVGGVERDAYAAPVAYWVMNRHPGDLGTGAELRVRVARVTNPLGTAASADGLEWAKLPAFGATSGERQVLHVFRADRPGQTRGISYLAPIIEPLKQLDRYSEAELTAAVLSAMFTVFVTSEPDPETGEAGGLGPIGGAAGPGQPALGGEYKLGNGAIIDLAPGEKIETASPNRPNPQFDPFFVACVKAMGTALEQPLEVLLKHFSSSYSASRAALLEAWRAYLTRRAWLVRVFCEPVREWVLGEAIARGHLQAPGFFDDPLARRAWLGAQWTGPTMGQLRPSEEVTAAGDRLRLGLSTLQDETAALTGGDWERNHAQQAKERRRRVSDGLEPVAVAPVAPGATALPAPRPPATDAPDDDADDDALPDDVLDDEETP